MRIIKFFPSIYHIALILFLAALFSCGSSPAPDLAVKYQQYLQQANGRGQFNGNVLVVKHGNVVFQGAYGTADAKVGKSLDLNSVFRLASVSKQFTAMAVMILKEDGKLSYDQELKEFFPELPYEGITIRHLLNHTSGLPDYIGIMDKHWKVEYRYQSKQRRISGNQDVINILAEHTPEVHFLPGEQWRYSNTGYMLLASIVAKVSGLPFSEFMQQRIFGPAGMNSSSVYNYKIGYDPEMPNRTFSFEKQLNGTDIRSTDEHYLNAAAGDGGIYSTLGDLFKWDRILYTEKLVSKETLNEAFTPAVLNNGGTTDYGFGWYIKNLEGGRKEVWHTGGWAGFSSYIVRDVDDDHCIIFLSNNANNYFWPLLTNLNNILHNKPYRLPRLSVKDEIGEVLLNTDLDAAVARYQKIKAEKPDDYIINDQELNQLGYQLLWDAKIQEAKGIFELNIEEYPDSANGYDSLGDALIALGDTVNALINFRKAYELDPNFNIPKRKIDQIEGREEKDPSIWPVIKDPSGC